MENEEIVRPTRTVYTPPELTDYYELSLDTMLEQHLDRYELVMRAGALSREINAARLQFSVSSPEKPTKVALNEIQYEKTFEPRTPSDLQYGHARLKRTAAGEDKESSDEEQTEETGKAEAGQEKSAGD